MESSWGLKHIGFTAQHSVKTVNSGWHLAESRKLVINCRINKTTCTSVAVWNSRVAMQFLKTYKLIRNEFSTKPCLRYIYDSCKKSNFQKTLSEDRILIHWQLIENWISSSKKHPDFTGCRLFIPCLQHFLCAR